MSRGLRGLVAPVPALAALLAAVLGLAVASGATADVEDEYKQGLAAVEKGDWAAAVRHLEAAIAERPKESSKLLRYLYFHPYLPHYYLGIARAELGDCRAALAEWAESEGQGVITGRDEYADLKTRRGRCEEAVGAAEAAAARAAAAVERAAAAAGDLADLAAGAEMEALWHEGEPSFASRQEAAERKLARPPGRLLPLRRARSMKAPRKRRRAWPARRGVFLRPWIATPAGAATRRASTARHGVRTSSGSGARRPTCWPAWPISSRTRRGFAPVGPRSNSSWPKGRPSIPPPRPPTSSSSASG